MYAHIFSVSEGTFFRLGCFCELSKGCLAMKGCESIFHLRVAIRELSQHKECGSCAPR
jgi:hypothetical protein